MLLVLLGNAIDASARLEKCTQPQQQPCSAAGRDARETALQAIMVHLELALCVALVADALVAPRITAPLLPRSYSETETPGWKRATPNALTALRFGCVPVVFGALRCDAPRLACGCFAGASITDAFDGYLARRWRVESRLGAFLDPVADKLLVVTTLVALTASTPGVALPAAVIVAREVAVSALREYCADRGQRVAVAVGGAGKLKTATQMAALLVLTGRLAPRAGLAAQRVGRVGGLFGGIAVCASEACFCGERWVSF